MNMFPRASYRIMVWLLIAHPVTVTLPISIIVTQPMSSNCYMVISIFVIQPMSSNCYMAHIHNCYTAHIQKLLHGPYQ